ncbi:hypothetical protein FBU30_007567 [Linnemannia zychae]|nr:hypothetical protein FBU30_007567 [Linnemannia zychae]
MSNPHKSNSAFFKKNTITFAVGGGCIIAAFFICFFGIICSRRRKKLQKNKERKQEEDSYQMSETNRNRDLYRKSNIRIGLDPNENGMVDVFTPYDGSQGSSSSNSLTKRPSTNMLNTKARAGRPAGPYAPDSLLTEQEMVLDLESDSNQRIGSSLSNWSTPSHSRERTGYFDIPPSHIPLSKSTADKGKGTLQKSPSSGNHMVYVPPPLPPPAITTPTTSILPGVISPYADEAMMVFPPDSPPRPVTSNSKTSSSRQAPVIRIGEAPVSQRPDVAPTDDDEPPLLDLNNSLTVERCRAEGGKLPSRDRTSVSSFFSGLALDEPIHESYSLSSILSEPSFASEEYVMPAPIARVIPVPTSRSGISPSSGSSVSTSLSGSSQPNTPPSTQQAAYDRQQEEIQVASCFAQDLGFEIVHPSPTGSPRHQAVTPTGSRRL